MTARSLDGEQYESQFLKIFVEWGFIGFTLFLIWFFRIIKDTDKNRNKLLSSNYIPLLVTILFNFEGSMYFDKIYILQSKRFLYILI